jgi:acetyl esterase/lipase
MKNLMQNLLYKFNLEKPGKKQLLSVLKNGVSYLYNFLNSSNEELSMPSIDFIKTLFEAYESKLSHQTSGETTKINEVVYLQKKSNENFKLLLEKEVGKRKLKNLIKLRVLTNQLVKINYENPNIHEIRENWKIREFNFFGLLLRVSKDFLTPSYNVILHIPGGGFFSQSSSSHLDYLSNWAKVTNTVIISLDYKLSADNQYPLLLDECISAYEIIVGQTVKLFGKYFLKKDFNINKLLIYCDSVGALVAFDIIKNAVRNKIRLPDEVIFVYPCVNLLSENLTLKSMDPFSILGCDENIHDEFMEMPFYCKLAEFFNKDDVCPLDDRLNCFLTDPNLISNFPPFLIVSSGNEPIRQECEKLAEFLKYFYLIFLGHMVAL